MKVLLEMLGDAAHALSNLEGVDELRPKSRGKLRTVLERIVRQSSELLDELEAAEEEEPDEREGRGELIERALAAMARDQHEEAESILRRGVQEFSDDVELLNHLGLACWERGKLGAAESAYCRAMEAGLEDVDRTGDNSCSGPSSEYLRAVEGRALCLYRLEQFDRAVSLFDTLGSMAPDEYAGCHYLAGEIRHLQGRPAEAVEFYERSPDEPSVHYNLGLARFEIGDHEEAARVLIRGFAANPYIAGMLLDREPEVTSGPGGYLGTATYAEEFLEACSNLWEGRPEALEFLARCFEHPSVREYLRSSGSASDGDLSDRGSHDGSRGGRLADGSELDGIVREVVGRME